MTKIINCTVENILGAKNIAFSPNGKNVTIGGANGEGKSSAIKALIMALGGRGEVPSKPVHNGEDKGTVVVELEDLVVTLTVDTDRKTKLVVTNKDGKKYPNGQTMLNELFGGLSFDPGQFRSSAKDKQFKILVELLNVDPTALESEHDQIYALRRDKGRVITELEGKIAGRRYHHDAPKEEIDVSGSLAKLRELHGRSSQVSALRSSAASKEAEAQRLTDRNTRNTAEVARLQAEIERIQCEMAENVQSIKTLDSEAYALRSQIKDLEANDDSKAEAEKLDAQLKDLNATNDKVKENRETDRLSSELETLRREYGDYTAELRTIEEKIKQLVAAAPVPIPGLSVSRGQVLYNDIVFEQLSESEQWKVSTAIGFSLNPKGIVFMANCGGLDRRSRDQVRSQAADLGVQLFLEVVDDADDVQLLIEEGAVKENRLEPSSNGHLAVAV